MEEIPWPPQWHSGGGLSHPHRPSYGAVIDDAIRLRPAMLDFLQQNVDDPDDFHSAKERLERILGE